MQAHHLRSISSASSKNRCAAALVTGVIRRTTKRRPFSKEAAEHAYTRSIEDQGEMLLGQQSTSASALLDTERDDDALMERPKNRFAG